jgi:hypothetical protein
MVMHTCNPSIWEAEAGGSWVQGQPGLHLKTLFQIIVSLDAKVFWVTTKLDPHKVLAKWTMMTLCLKPKYTYLKQEEHLQCSSLSSPGPDLLTLLFGNV